MPTKIVAVFFAYSLCPRNFTGGQAMTSCGLQFNIVAPQLHGGPVVLRLVRATLC